MGKLMYSQDPRICYENGNKITGKKIYELHASCTCEDCKNRISYKREPKNDITATTMELLKVDEVKTFLTNWTCDNGKQWAKTVYIKF